MVVKEIDTQEALFLNLNIREPAASGFLEFLLELHL
jgi:hypothetical protein